MTNTPETPGKASDIEALAGRTYHGWSIGPDYVGWTATGPNYDASYEGEEDGWVDNGEKSWGRTRAECEAGIDEWLEENADDTP